MPEGMKNPTLCYICRRALNEFSLTGVFAAVLADCAQWGSRTDSGCCCRNLELSASC